MGSEYNSSQPSVESNLVVTTQGEKLQSEFSPDTNDSVECQSPKHSASATPHRAPEMSSVVCKTGRYDAESPMTETLTSAVRVESTKLSLPCRTRVDTITCNERFLVTSSPSTGLAVYQISENTQNSPELEEVAVFQCDLFRSSLLCLQPGRSDVLVLANSDHIRLWRLDDIVSKGNQMNYESSCVIGEHFPTLSCCHLAESPESVIALGLDQEVWLLDYENVQQCGTLYGLESRIYTANITGDQCAATSVQGQVIVWDWRRGEVIWTWRSRIPCHVPCVELHLPVSPSFNTDDLSCQSVDLSAVAWISARITVLVTSQPTCPELVTLSLTPPYSTGSQNAAECSIISMKAVRLSSEGPHSSNLTVDGKPSRCTAMPQFGPHGLLLALTSVGDVHLISTSTWLNIQLISLSHSEPVGCGGIFLMTRGQSLILACASAVSGRSKLRHVKITTSIHEPTTPSRLTTSTQELPISSQLTAPNQNLSTLSQPTAPTQELPTSSQLTTSINKPTTPSRPTASLQKIPTPSLLTTSTQQQATSSQLNTVQPQHEANDETSIIQIHDEEDAIAARNNCPGNEQSRSSLLQQASSSSEEVSRFNLEGIRSQSHHSITTVSKSLSRLDICNKRQPTPSSSLTRAIGNGFKSEPSLAEDRSMSEVLIAAVAKVVAPVETVCTVEDTNRALSVFYARNAQSKPKEKRSRNELDPCATDDVSELDSRVTALPRLSEDYRELASRVSCSRTVQKPVTVFGSTNDQITHIAVSGRGTRLACTSRQSKTIEVLKLRRTCLPVVDKFLAGGLCRPVSLSWTLDDEYLLGAFDRGLLLWHHPITDAMVTKWQPDSARPAKCCGGGGGRTAELSDANFFYMDAFILAAVGSRMCVLKYYENSISIAGHCDTPCHHILTSAAENRCHCPMALAACSDHHIRLLDMHSGQCVGNLLPEPRRNCSRAQLCADIAATLSPADGVRLWDVRSGRLAHRLLLPSVSGGNCSRRHGVEATTVSTFAISPDASVVAAGVLSKPIASSNPNASPCSGTDSSQLWFWDLRMPQVTSAQVSVAGSIHDLTFHPRKAAVICAVGSGDLQTVYIRQ